MLVVVVWHQNVDDNPNEIEVFQLIYPKLKSIDQRIRFLSFLFFIFTNNKFNSGVEVDDSIVLSISFDIIVDDEWVSFEILPIDDGTWDVRPTEHIGNVYERSCI